MVVTAGHALSNEMEQAAGRPRALTRVPDPAKAGYANGELSWLDFNERVLGLARDAGLPALERTKFLAIYTTNLDEFFMVRVAGLSPSETLDAIEARVRRLEQTRSHCFTREIVPALDSTGIRIRACEACAQSELAELDRIFHAEVFPVLTPLALRRGRRLPFISNLSLSLAVCLRDPLTGVEAVARVKVPKDVLPRFVRVGHLTFVPLEEVIARHLHDLFPGMEIVRHSLFRVTRHTNFTVSDEGGDRLQAVKDEVRRRRLGEVVRLEIGSGIHPNLRARLISWLDVEERQVYDIEGLLDTSDLPPRALAWPS